MISYFNKRYNKRGADLLSFFLLLKSKQELKCYSKVCIIILLSGKPKK